MKLLMQELHLEKCTELEGFALTCLAALTQLRRLELGEFQLDLELELRGDYSDPGRKGALDRLWDDLCWHAAALNMDQEELEEEFAGLSDRAESPYNAVGNARQACERAKFVDMLATLSKLKVALGEAYQKD